MSNKATMEQLELIDEAKELLNSMKRNFKAKVENTLPKLYEILETLADGELEDEELGDDILEPVYEVDF